MNKRKGLFSIALLVLLLCSCSAQMKPSIAENVREAETEKEVLVTPEELYQMTGLTPEDFIELDVNEFIESNQLTRDNIYWAESCYRSYFTEETEPAVSYEEEYRYLFDSPLKKLETGMADQIKTVYVNYIFGAGFAYTGRDSILYDFKNKRVFHNTFSEYDNDVSEQEREDLKKLIEESGIKNLKAEKKGLGVTHEGYEIIIESEDGRIAHYKGEDTMPGKAEKFCEGIFTVRRER